MQRSYRITCYIIVVSSLFIYIGYEYYKNSPKIINYPEATSAILQPVAELDIASQHVPDYRYTSNASLLAQSKTDGYLSAYHKVVYYPERYYHTKLYIMSLDKSYNIQTNQLLELDTFYNFYTGHVHGLSTAEDPRLIQHNNKNFLLYNDSVTRGARTVYLAELQQKEHEFAISSVKQLDYNNVPIRNEKNWTPFVHNNNLYFIYSIAPHLILRFDADTEQVLKAYDNGQSFDKYWQYGQVRGGTPAIYVKELDAYLSFFHSSKKYKQPSPAKTGSYQPKSRIYYVGAMLFAAKPPFQILRYTPKALSYHAQYDNLKQDYHIIFPTGLVEEEDSFILSSGLQDARTTIFKVSKRDLYNELQHFVEMQ